MGEPVICTICGLQISPEDIANKETEKCAGGLSHSSCYWGQDNFPINEDDQA